MDEQDLEPSDDRTLCGKCGARPATNHICFGGTVTTLDLCDDCLRADDSFAGKFAASLVDEAKSARCRYCGGFPCSGGSDSLSQITGASVQKRWMCMSCSAEYLSRLQSALGSMPGNLTADEQIARIKEIGLDIDSHMAAYVALRDN